MRIYDAISEKNNSCGPDFSRRHFLKSCAALIAGCTASGIAGTAWTAEKESKMLIVYFSHSGNTKTVAEEIHNFTGAPMVEIRPVVKFPDNHAELVRLAEKQAADGFRPEFAVDLPNDLQSFNVIFLGFPIWAYTMPMIVYSFLDKYKFPGKSIAPFSTHAGSGLADAPEQIARLCPDAKILPGIAIRGTRAADSSADVKSWLSKLGLLK